jgi:tetratricopeptide (TPR) repeat protein
MIQSKFRSPHKLTTRAELLSLLDSAIYTESYRFARQISLMWLAYFPGDLPVRLKYGHLLLNAGQKDQAIQQLTELCLSDPEYLDAWQLLSVSLEGYSKNPAATDSAFFIADCQSALHALGENIIASAPLPSWADGVLRARQALFQGEISTAEEYIHQVMVVDPMPALVAVTHLHILRASELPSQAVQNLSEFYGQRFQNTVAPTFFLAEALMDSGEPDKAVAFLHQGVSLDVSGLVANRIWRDGNPYTDIWPDQLEAPIEIPIPAEVAALYGRNRLPQQSSPSNYQFNNKNSQTENDNVSDDKRINHESRIFSPEVIQLREPKRRVSAAASGIVVSEKASAVPESLVSIHSELEKVATRLKKRPLSQQDGRYPVYVVITTRQGLENHYPQDQVDSLDECMKRVVQNVSTRQDWGAIRRSLVPKTCLS